jgi:PAS domain S-box-containing protein
MAASPPIVEAGVAAQASQQPVVRIGPGAPWGLVLFAVPVPDPQDEGLPALGGVVLGEDPAEFAADFLDTSHHGAPVTVLLVERGRQGPALVFPPVLEAIPPGLDALLGESAAFRELAGPEGSVLVHARPLRRAPLWLVARVSRAEALRPAFRDAALTGLATLGLLLGATLPALERLRRVRVQHAAELSRSLAELQRLQHILEQIPVSVIVTGQDGRIEYLNAHVSEVSGYSRQELLGRDPRFLEATPLPPDFYAEIETTIRAGRSWRGQFENRRKDGSVVLEDALISPGRDAAGRITHFIAVKRDITELRKREAELRDSRLQLTQAQKMEALGRLAGGIAHDFNNLLGVIIGYAGMALRVVPGDDPLHRKLSEIEKAAERGASLTRQLLAYSRKQVLALTVVDLNAAMADVSGMLARLIGEDVELVLDPGADLMRVRVDRGQIEQVLLNLAANARDAMPRGGKLTLRTSNEEVGPDDPRRRGLMPVGRYVRLEVTDNGSGMSEEVQAHVFEPFFTTKEYGRGTGLGLSTVYGIVKQSDGFVWVDSAPGRGTSFEIFLPAVDAQAAPAARAPAESRHGAGRWVLIVEDNGTLREMEREVLTQAGYRVLEAADGDAALSIAKQHPEPIALLLSDIVLPRRSGPEIAVDIQRMRPGIRMLFSSGYTADMASVQGILDQGHAFLPKPVTPEALLSRVGELLGS